MENPAAKYSWEKWPEKVRPHHIFHIQENTVIISQLRLIPDAPPGPMKWYHHQIPQIPSVPVQPSDCNNHYDDVTNATHQQLLKREDKNLNIKGKVIRVWSAEQPWVLRRPPTSLSTAHSALAHLIFYASLSTGKDLTLASTNKHGYRPNRQSRTTDAAQGTGTLLFDTTSNSYMPKQSITKPTVL
jgi:hypothetical protein